MQGRWVLPFLMGDCTALPVVTLLKSIHRWTNACLEPALSSKADAESWGPISPTLLRLRELRTQEAMVQ